MLSIHRMALLRPLAVAFVAATMLGCKTEFFEGPTGPVDPTADVYASSLGIDIANFAKTTSGVYYKDLVVGTGNEVAEGDSIRVHYTGYLVDGRVFDSSRGGSPLEQRLRRASGTQPGLIPGFVDGIVGMKVGGRRKFVIPSALAYGATGASQAGIPRYANLVFDVELLAKL